MGGNTFLNRVTASGGVLLSDAHISGQLICSGASLTGLSGGDALVADGIRVGSAVALDGGFTASGTVRLAGADISGQLICGGARLTGLSGAALVADGMRVRDNVYLHAGFTASGTVRLAGADITGQLVCHGARLSAGSGGVALFADGMRAGGYVYLDEGFVAAGMVRLFSADITGQLSLRGAHLAGPEGGPALFADLMKVNGSVYFDQGFTAAGTIRLAVADIAGVLSLRGARLTCCDGDGNALIAAGIKVGRDLFLDGGFTANGTIQLSRADITGVLAFSSAQLTHVGRGAYAVVADGVEVGGDVLLDNGFKAAGTVSLNSARIAGSLRLTQAKLADGDDTMALNATAAQIAHTLRWAPGEQVDGGVSLEDAVAGQLEDDWTEASGPANGNWPAADRGLLRLDGFTYNRISGIHRATLEQRLQWLGSQRKHTGATKRTGFATQPYEQLANVCRQAGRDAEARTVAIARRRDLRRYGDLTRSRSAGNWLLDKTIRYGYETWRAVLALAFVYLVVLGIFWGAQHRPGLVVPAQDTAGIHPAPTAARCTTRYPCFYPAGYAIDTVIPLINVHQAEDWRPNASAPFGWFFVLTTWAGTGLGWTLATLVVAGYTGLARNADAP